MADWFAQNIKIDELEQIKPETWIWILVCLGVALVCIALIAAVREKTFNTHALTVTAMLVALFVVFSFVATLDLGQIKITFSAIPIILGAMLFGLPGGLLVGLLGSFLEQLLRYGLDVTTVLWIMPAAVRGILVGWYAKKKDFSLTRGQLLMLIAISSLVVTALNSGVMYLDGLIKHYPTAILGINLVIRILSGLATAVVMAYAVPPLLKLLRGTLDRVRRQKE